MLKKKGDDNIIIISVFTASHNRKDLLKRLYDSLCIQTDMRFEWIVCDDSEDGADGYIKKFISEEKIKIKYCDFRKIKNNGLNAKFNKALDIAEGKLITKVDDDDYLFGDAIEKLIYFDSTIFNKNEFVGVSGNKSYPNGKPIGDKWIFNTEYVDYNELERVKYSLDGDRAQAYYVDVLRKNGYMPIIDGEHATLEAIYFHRIAHKGYKVRWFNKNIQICEYLQGGFTKNIEKIFVNNFKTYSLYIKERIDYKELPFINRFGSTCRYFEIARKKRIKLYDIKENFINHKFLMYICYFTSFFTEKIIK